MADVKITLIKSLIGCKKPQIATAEALGLGETIELVPSADDPKDLFRHTRRGRARRALRRAA